MSVDPIHYIHSRGGRIGIEGSSTLTDVERVVAAFRATHSPRALTIHFHGGLVSKHAGFEIAKNLLPVYKGQGGNRGAIFYVWESGAWETIRNNFTELADEPVFKNLLRKVLEYALRKLGMTDGARSIQPTQVDPEEVKQALRDFMENPSPETIPYVEYEPVVSRERARSASTTIELDELQADLEGDEDLKRALATLPDIPTQRRSALLLVGNGEKRTPFSLIASEALSEDPGRRGLIAWFKVAWFLKNVIVGVLRRYAGNRDHGLYATCLEELVRAFKFGGSAGNEWGKALQWNRMNKDWVDAFGPNPNEYAGTALLLRLRDALAAGTAIERINLVGHSTGAIAICEWLEAADAALPADVRFDVVFLAPAVSYERFDKTLQKCGHRIDRFRMFAMSDELERQDQVWGNDTQVKQDWRRFIYPSSLLYLVSGILESREQPDGTLVDEADLPLLGMERYFLNSEVYDPEGFPEVQRVRSWLNEDAQRTVWSLAQDQGPGHNSSCNDHGAFDNEPATIASLRHIVEEGF